MHLNWHTLSRVSSDLDFLADIEIEIIYINVNTKKQPAICRPSDDYDVISHDVIKLFQGSFGTLRATSYLPIKLGFRM